MGSTGRGAPPDADLAQAAAELRAGHPRRALKRLTPLLERHADNAAASHLAGIACQQLGRTEEALEHLRHAARLKPGEAVLHVHLGEVARGAGDHARAVEAYRAALVLAPNHGGARAGLAAALEALDDPGAAAAFEHALALAPRDATLLIRLAGLRSAAGAREAAIDLLRRAVSAQPGLAAAHNNLGVLLTEAGRSDEAAAALARAATLAPDRADYHRNHAVALVAARRHGKAAEAYGRAIALAPGDADLLAGLSSLEERRHQLAAARDAAEQALAIDPAQAEAVLTLARLDRRAERHQQAADLLMPVLAREDPPLAIRTAIATELGMMRDRLDDPEGAVAAFALANELHERGAAAAAIDREAFPRSVARMDAFVARARFETWPKLTPDGRADPIFLVGFPRSGTTLTEQMLSAHPALVTTDEEPVLIETLARIGGEARYPESLESLDAEAVSMLREAYFRGLASTLGEYGERLPVDKLPLNLTHLPAIRRLFPQARVIVALRDPRDVVLSAWMQNFDLNPAMIQFLTLEAAARSYAAVMGLWLAMRPVIGLSWIEHRYEDVVADAPAAARRLIEFLGLEWDDAVLGFGAAARSRVISTPSARDVAGGGVFSRARGRWTRYRPWMAAALPILAPAVAALGYAPSEDAARE